MIRVILTRNYNAYGYDVTGYEDRFDIKQNLEHIDDNN